jgi:hypothetical protein
VLFPFVPVVAVVVAVELAAWAWRQVHCPGDPPTLAVPNVEDGWNHPPGATGEAYACAGPDYEWRRPVTLNSRGLADVEHDDARTPGVARVLVLGDSVAEALQVPREENFSRRLAVMLAQGGCAADVVNSGHSGFGTDNELLFYEAEGRRYRPDVVLLVVNLQNDIAENSPVTLKRMYEGGPAHPKAGVILDGAGNVQLVPTEYAVSAAQWKSDPWRSSPPLAWLREHSFFVRHLANLLMGERRPKPLARPSDWPGELDVYATPPDRNWLDARTITSALIRRLRTDVEKDGAKLLVAVVPSRETTSPALWENLVAWFPKLAGGSWDLEMPRRWIDGELSAGGYASVDCTEAIRAGQAGTGKTGYFAFDPHPDASGHEWIAAAVYPALARMLDESSGCAKKDAASSR